jgi:hypothetical protein
VIRSENKFTGLELIEEPKMITILLAEFVAERISFGLSEYHLVPALTQNLDVHKFKDDGRGAGNGCDKMADNIG